MVSRVFWNGHGIGYYYIVKLRYRIEFFMCKKKIIAVN